MMDIPMLLRHANSRFAFLIAALILLCTPASAQTDKAATVINDMITALGGKTFLEVREIKSSGKIFGFKNDTMAGSDVFVDYVKFPDKRRTEYGTYRIKPAEIINGETGWNIDLPKVESKPPAEARSLQAGFKTGFQYVARFILNRPGLVLQHVGTELIVFRSNDVIEFRDSGNLLRLFVDQQSHLPTKMEVRRSGEAFIREEQYANWHDFQGIQTALFIIRLKDGEREREIRFDNVSYNPGMADSLFAPPAAR
jgi:hypothetical protein